MKKWTCLWRWYQQLKRVYTSATKADHERRPQISTLATSGMWSQLFHSIPVLLPEVVLGRFDAFTIKVVRYGTGSCERNSEMKGRLQTSYTIIPRTQSGLKVNSESATVSVMHLHLPFFPPRFVELINFLLIVIVVVVFLQQRRGFFFKVTSIFTSTICTIQPRRVCFLMSTFN